MKNMAIKKKTQRKSVLAVAAVLALGLLLGLAILRTGKARPAGDAHGHAESAAHADGDHQDEHPDEKAGGEPGHDEAGHGAAEPQRETAAGAARVRLSEAQLQRHGVELGTAGPARIRSSLQLLGEVRLNQDRSVFVTPRLAGLVEAVRASAGERVRRGQVLAVISSQVLADLRAQQLAAQQRLALARASHEREKRLWEDKISAQQDYLAARQAFEEAEIAAASAAQKLASLGAAVADSSQGLTRYEIRAPIDGVVTDKKISVGEVLKEDAPIFQIADLSSVWVELSVPARELNRLKVGDAAVVKASAYEALAEARLAYVGALVGEQSRQAMARLVLPNPKGWWRPGLPVSVALSTDEVEVPVAVAVDALQSLGEATVVFGRAGEQFEARPLVLGRSDGRHAEVLKGLAAGERYATRNSFLIKAEIGKAGAGHEH